MAQPSLYVSLWSQTLLIALWFFQLRSLFQASPLHADSLTRGALYIPPRHLSGLLFHTHTLRLQQHLPVLCLQTDLTHSARAYWFWHYTGRWIHWEEQSRQVLLMGTRSTVTRTKKTTPLPSINKQILVTTKLQQGWYFDTLSLGLKLRYHFQKLTPLLSSPCGAHYLVLVDLVVLAVSRYLRPFCFSSHQHGTLSPSSLRPPLEITAPPYLLGFLYACLHRAVSPQTYYNSRDEQLSATA